jgi:hypothetical protein
MLLVYFHFLNKIGGTREEKKMGRCHFVINANPCAFAIHQSVLTNGYFHGSNSLQPHLNNDNITCFMKVSFETFIE